MVIAVVIAVVAAAHVFTFAYLSLKPSKEDYSHRMGFNAQQWRDKSIDRDPAWPTRLRMADDLVAKKQLDGLTRAEVDALLGPRDETDKWKDWDLVYWLGPERGYFRIDSEWLVIRFNGSGRVQSYRIVRD